jgi:cation transport regulator ChaC
MALVPSVIARIFAETDTAGESPPLPHRRVICHPCSMPSRRFPDIDAVIRHVQRRIRWRRWVARSWLVSRWHYRRHGLVLEGRPSDLIWYFAYGSNMHEGTFVGRRRIRPLDRRVGRVVGYRLRFNLEGRPKGKAAPANICPDPDQEVWGVLYKITRRDLLRLNATEGVPGRGYRPVLLDAEDANGTQFAAVAYVAKGKETDGIPSLRYISLLRDGARFHALPEQWLRFLDGVQHHAE